MAWNPLDFDRDIYLKHSTSFENVDVSDCDEEMTEFSGDAEDMAFEIAYLRYHYAKQEAELKHAQEKIEALRRDSFAVECKRCHCLFVPGGKDTTDICAGCYKEQLEQAPRSCRNIDDNLDVVLKASGSALKNYTWPPNLDRMRKLCAASWTLNTKPDITTASRK